MLSKYLYLQSRLNQIIWRNFLNHHHLFSASPFSTFLNLHPYWVLLTLLYLSVTGWRGFIDVRLEVQTVEVQVNKTTSFYQTFYLFWITEEMFFMSFCASEGNLKLPINKKFFIPELILIFVPLQKSHLRKSIEKLNLKQFFYQL